METTTMEEFLEGFDDNLDGNYIIILGNTENDFEFSLENSLKFDKVDEEIDKSNLVNVYSFSNNIEETNSIVTVESQKPDKSEKEIKNYIENIYDKFHLDRGTIKVSQYKSDEIKETQSLNKNQQPELTCFIKSGDERLRNRKITSLEDTLDEVRNGKNSDGCFVVIVEDQNVKFTKVTTSDRVNQGNNKKHMAITLRDIVKKLSSNDITVKHVKEDPEPILEELFFEDPTEFVQPEGVIIKTDDGTEYLFDSVTNSLPKSENIIAKKAEQINLKENFKFEAKFSCDRCNYSTKSLDDLKSHKVNHPPMKVFKCDACTYKTTDLRALYQHMEQPKCKKIFRCDRCDFTCDKPPLLYQHKKIHPKVVTPVCNICEVVFKTAADLNEHRKIHIFDDFYKCEFCNYKTMNSQTLKSHRYTHSDEKPFTCEVCSKSFKRHDILQSHRKTHSKEKPFACDLCDYRSRFRNNLIGHRRTHFDDKPYACDVCAHRTKSMANLRVHKKTHLEVKSLSCDLCSYKTNSNTHLRHHKKIHSGEMSYKCEFCEFKCKHPNSLVNHKRRTHKAGKKDALQASVEMLDLNFFDQGNFVTNSIV